MKFFSLALAAAAATAVFADTLGKATFYWQHGVTGYCGAVNPESALIIAASPHSGLTCGELVHITNTGGGLNNHGIGKSITATVADCCPPEECRPENLDLSVGAFKALTGGSLDLPGAIGIEFEVVGGWRGRGIYSILT